ncbi:MAG TPA: nucleoside-triphosphatase [Thermodesulfobacteriota bacterium]|nr:nucleoside-triphosphatase [Thermodesulfobacteriota bacterium]
MDRGRKNILITGLPGIGKTTLIKQLVYELSRYRPRGFYTEEIRHEDERKGFQLVSLDGKRSMLAHVLIDSPYQIGKYKVNVSAFDSFLDSLDLGAPEGGIVIIDEIGKMECLSVKFVRIVQELLDSGSIVIATIAHTDGGIKGKIKEREDVLLFRMNLENRDVLKDEITCALKDMPLFRRLTAESG